MLRTAVTHLDQQAAQGMANDVHMVGKKGISNFRYLRREVSEQTTRIDDKPRFDEVEPIANELIDRFVRGEIASVYVVYTKFVSAGQQRPVAVQLLPLKPEAVAGETPAAKKSVEYEFSPDPRQHPRRAAAGDGSRCGSSSASSTRRSASRSPAWSP